MSTWEVTINVTQIYSTTVDAEDFEEAVRKVEALTDVQLKEKGELQQESIDWDDLECIDCPDPDDEDEKDEEEEEEDV